MKRPRPITRALQAHAAKHPDGQEDRWPRRWTPSYAQDKLQAETDEQLYKLGVISGLAYKKSKSTADQLATQHKLSLQQLDVNEKNIEVQLASSQAKIDQAKALLALYQKQTDALAGAGRHRRRA